MANKYGFKGLFTNDVVVFRNGDRGIVSKNAIILQSGGFLERNHFRYTNIFRFNEDNDYDIVKIYHNYEDDIHFFNITDNKKYLIWTAEFNFFPKLENGDVVVLNNGNIYMKVDNTLVNQKGGYMDVSKYEINGEYMDASDNEWDIKEVYRNNWYTDKKYYVFDVVNFDENLIWERC